MSRTIWFTIFIALSILGCGSLENTTQTQINRSRTYTVDKTKLLSSIQSFALSNEFRISVWDERSGHVTGERNEVGTGTFVMSLDINPIDNGRCNVLVDFSLRTSSGATSQEDRILINDWYDKLFNYLDVSMK